MKKEVEKKKTFIIDLSYMKYLQPFKKSSTFYSIYSISGNPRNPQYYLYFQ